MKTDFNSIREKSWLTDNWFFIRNKMGRPWFTAPREPTGEKVFLPHCWNTSDSYQQNVDYYRGFGSYRMTFPFTRADHSYKDRIWLLESEGFYGIGSVWLNGIHIGDVDGQYLGFSIDVGRHLIPNADNTIGILLTNRCPAYILPGCKMPDFLLYGGLSGRVCLTGVPACHFDEHQLTLRYDHVMDEAPIVMVNFVLRNRSSQERQCVTRWTIADATGSPVATLASGPIHIGQQADTEQLTIELFSPDLRLWSVQRPVLYSLVCELVQDNQIIDRVEKRFGIRDALFKPDHGFYLNGEHVALRGCNRHETYPGFGNALPARLHRKDAELIKQLGLNFVRLSHYPQHPEFLDACDELGILVYAEIASWKSVRRGRWLKRAGRQMRDMIIRDRHHPSIILWGMGNESRSRSAFLALRDIARKTDPSRPVIYAENHYGRARWARTVHIPDVWGSNYEMDTLAAGRDAARLRVVVVSECSNEPNTMPGNWEAEIRQTMTIAHDVRHIETLDYVAGFALWSFNDYATLRKKRYMRHSGIVNAWRAPKMSAALLQALFLEKPFVKIFGYWGMRQTNCPAGNKDHREIHVFTNCESAAIILNGREIACLPGPHGVCSVNYEPGELMATGKYPGGEISDKLVPYGEASNIAISREAPEASHDDQTPIEIIVRIQDAAGRLVANWAGLVDITVEGPGILKSHIHNKLPIFNGMGQCWIIPIHDPGPMITRVEYPGLINAKHVVSSQKGAT